MDDLLRQPGATLQQAFVQSGVFTLDDTGMIGNGERAGSVPEMLERLAGYHGDTAATAKTKSRMIAIQMLVLFLIISTGLVTIFMMKDYAGFVLGITKWVGGPQ